jgi:hypothetical protein
MTSRIESRMTTFLHVKFCVCVCIGYKRTHQFCIKCRLMHFLNFFNWNGLYLYAIILLIIMYLENLAQFIYLGTAVINQNLIQE